MTDTLAVPDDSIALHNGAAMPLLGFGTWQIKGKNAVRATSVALEAGYRHLDTATVYGNEAEVGRALAESGVPRDAVFLTTKCPPRRAGRELDTLHESLEKLQTDRVDLWLIHWPGDGRTNLDLWGAFVEARESGLAREIGVSNFDAALIDEVTGSAGVAPAVNQIEWSPMLFDRGVVDGHRRRGIQLEGYSPLRATNLRDPRLVGIAETHGVTPAQVVLRWHVEHGIVAIPKSTNEGRITENAAIFDFELTPTEMTTLDGLGR